MSLIKSLWPTPFKIRKGNVLSLLIQLVIFLLICAVVGWLFSVLSGVPVLGVIFYFVGGLMELYGLVGIVLCVLKFLGMV